MDSCAASFRGNQTFTGSAQGSSVHMGTLSDKIGRAHTSTTSTKS